MQLTLKVQFFLMLFVFFSGGCASPKKQNTWQNTYLFENQNKEKEISVIHYDGLLTDTVFSKAQIQIQPNHYFQVFYINDKKRMIFTKPSDTLKVKVSGQALTFEGRYKKENECFQKILELDKSYGEQFDSLHSLTYSEFTNTVGQIEETKKALLKTDSLDEDFVSLTKGYIDLYYHRKMFQYPYYASYYQDSLSIDTPLNYYQQPIFKGFDFNDTVLNQFDIYTNVIYLHVDKPLYNIYYGTKDYLEKSQNGILDKVSHPKVRAKSLHHNLYYHISASADKELTDTLMQSFTLYCEDQKRKDHIDALLSKWKGIAQGQISPDFSFLDQDSNRVSLSDFKGQNILIGTWATWCGPCKKQRPYLEKLVEDYKDKNIQVLYVSLDQDNAHNLWKKTSEKYKDFAVHLRAESGFKNAQIAKHFLIYSIPRFIALDHDLRIVNPNTKLPSQVDALDQFFEL